MKKIILLALTWPLISYPLYAQKDKKKNESREVIIIQDGDKEKKLTIETKDGEVYINGKPAKEYKDNNVIVTDKVKNFGDYNDFYKPGNKFKYFNDFSDKAYLGVSTEKSEDGVKITDVSKDSPADAAGLKEGDIITKVGDQKITTAKELNDAITARKPKDDVTISYKRDGKAADTKATLGQRNFSKTFSYDGSKIGNTDFNFKMPKMAQEPFSMAWGFNKGRLGVRVEDTDNDSGAKITDVDDESLAAKSGLKENDIITEINGKKVKDVNEVKRELAEVKDKSSYNIKAKRNGADMNFEIKIPKKINKADL